MKKLFVSVLILALLVSGCAALAEEFPVKVRLAVSHALETIEDCFFWSALYLGFFEEEGLDVELLPLAGTSCEQMAVSGMADLALPASNELLAAVDAGMDLVAVYQGAVHNVFGFVTLADSGLKDWKDLEGKNIVAWAGCEPLSNPILISAGDDPETVNYVAAFDERPAMLATGAADAALSWQGEWQVWEGTLKVDLNYFDGDDVLANCSNPWVCTRKYYEENKETIAKVGRAIAKGAYFCGANPEAAAAITMAIMPTVDISLESATKVAEAVYELWTPDNGVYGQCVPGKWALNVEWCAYYDAINPEKIDLDEILKSAEFEDAFNDWSREEMDAFAADFDISTIAW